MICVIKVSTSLCDYLVKNYTIQMREKYLRPMFEFHKTKEINVIENLQTFFECFIKNIEKKI